MQSHSNENTLETRRLHLVQDATHGKEFQRQKSGPMYLSPSEFYSNLKATRPQVFTACASSAKSLTQRHYRASEPLGLTLTIIMDWARILSSHRLLSASLIGLALVSAAALDVPQLSSEDIRDSYPLSLAPYIVFLGLNNLGSSLLLWALVLCLLIHIAARLIAYNMPKQALSRKLLTTSAILSLASLAALLASGLVHRPPDTTLDHSHLEVFLKDSAQQTATQIIEEGSVYETQSGQRLVCGTSSQGPYCVEAMPGGVLRIHIPTTSPHHSGTIAISARRPQSQTEAQFTTTRPWLALASAFLLMVAVWMFASPSASPSPHGLPKASILVIFALLCTLLSPLYGIGQAVSPIGSASGQPVLWLLTVRGPHDPATWLAALPITMPIPIAKWVNIATFVALLLLVSVSVSKKRPILAGISVAMMTLSSILWLLLSTIIPVAGSPVDLVSQFLDSILPRIPMEFSVFNAEPSTPGPYFVALPEGLVRASTYLVGAIALARFTLAKKAPGQSPLLAWVLVLLVAASRLLFSLLFAPPDSTLLPYTLVVLFIVTLAPLTSLSYSSEVFSATATVGAIMLLGSL